MSSAFTRAFFLSILWLSSIGLTQEEAKTWLIIHTDVPVAVLDKDGKDLGKSGKAIGLNYSGEPPETVAFVLKAEGYKDKTIQGTWQEISAENRLPSQGSYKMEAAPRNPVLYLLPLAFLAIAVFLRTKKKNEQPIAAEDPELFRLGDFLGEGSSASVYKGYSDVVGEEAIAIKILAEDYAKDEELRRRYERECEVSLSLDHPNIVRVFHSGSTKQGRPFLLMELLEGQTLAEFLESEGSAELEKASEIILPLCDALSYLHGLGIVHRDIKPGNIFLSKDGVVKLLDLGIARVEESVDITQTGQTLGSPSYMAPEQILGKFSPRTDQYSLGVVLFELLSGRKPFVEGDILKQHLRQAPPLLSSLDPSVNEFQDSVLNRLLEKRPEARFENMQEARQAIASCLSAADDGTMTC